ncbi:MAG: sterol desaturase family protein [Candidatus Berkiella sp.]
MEQWLLQYQVWCRIVCFVLAFSALSMLETFYTWRPWIISRRIRIARHLSLSVLSKMCIRLIFPFFTVALAVHLEQKEMGILHQPHWPYAARIILGIIGLDLVMYLLHRMYHKYQWLWRVHRVHHMDKELDASTGLRFHPIEEIITTAAKMTGIAFLGALPLCVLIFEVSLNLFTMFAHINIQFKHKTDVKIRRCFISPGMHRMHHSCYLPETNSNYGFIFSWWDKLLGTYTYVSVSGERKLALGLEEYQDAKYQFFENMLWIPFNLKRLRVKTKKRPKLKMSV